MNSKKVVLIAGATTVGAGVVCAAAGAATVGHWLRRRQRGRFAGKVVLITGASRGLGLALAEEFGRRGARLVLTARDASELERAQQLLEKRLKLVAENSILIVPADLRNPQEATAVIEKATTHFGRVDVLVNNAGVITVGPVENQRIDDFHDVMESNFFTGVHCTLSVLPQMLERSGGSIVNIASIGGKIPVPHLLPYTASKFAAVGFSEGLHAELRAHGIHVLTVCPGLMRTGSHRSALFSGNAEKEYRWFSISASLPGVSASASAAARQIVNAVAARRTEIAITPHAAIASRLASVAPEAVALAMSAVSRLLPNPQFTSTVPQRGADVRHRASLSVAAR